MRTKITLFHRTSLLLARFLVANKHILQKRQFLGLSMVRHHLGMNGPVYSGEEKTRLSLGTEELLFGNKDVKKANHYRYLGSCFQAFRCVPHRRRSRVRCSEVKPVCDTVKTYLKQLYCIVRLCEELQCNLHQQQFECCVFIAVLRLMHEKKNDFCVPFSYSFPFTSSRWYVCASKQQRSSPNLGMDFLQLLYGAVPVAQRL